MQKNDTGCTVVKKPVGKLCALLLLLCVYMPVYAQMEHDMHTMHHGSDTMTAMLHTSPADNMNMGMHSILSPHLPMNRDGSGTAWKPDASPVYDYMAHLGGWMLMAGGDIYVRYNRQDINNSGHRGGEKWDAPDMLMAMAQHKAGAHGLLGIHLMLSADALVTGGSGYPLLYQTGESYQGKPLVDRQHPHDLFSGLAVSYAYSFSKRADAFLYFGYPGDPALGPGFFLHRPSGMFLPDAALGHHWEDATHITFGVLTGGVRYGKFRIEASSFTGREPDENRYDFDKATFDSWSGRLSFNPSANWSLQVSHGYLHSPEALQPGENVHRSTASAMYVHHLSRKSYVVATLLAGQNVTDGQASNALLFEALLKLSRLAIYTRYEYVDKTAEELDLVTAYSADKFFPVHAVTLGTSYDVISNRYITIAAGGQLTLDATPAELKPLYGDHPLSGELYLHIYPPLMK